MKPDESTQAIPPVCPYPGTRRKPWAPIAVTRTTRKLLLCPGAGAGSRKDASARRLSDSGTSALDRVLGHPAKRGDARQEEWHDPSVGALAAGAVLLTIVSLLYALIRWP